MVTGNGNMPYICYFRLSCFAKENTKQSDHAGRAAASINGKLRLKLNLFDATPQILTTFKGCQNINIAKPKVT